MTMHAGHFDLRDPVEQFNFEACVIFEVLPAFKPGRDFVVMIIRIEIIDIEQRRCGVRGKPALTCMIDHVLCHAEEPDKIADD